MSEKVLIGSHQEKLTDGEKIHQPANIKLYYK